MVAGVEPRATVSWNMAKLLYLTATQFSGTTLLSFLLNQHTAIATVGHTMGWSFDDPDEFRCSCGERIADCPLFRHIAAAYDEHGLVFRPNEFGTAFRVTGHSALNYYLTEALPRTGSTRLEALRDSVVRLRPRWRRLLERQMQANRVFVDAVLDYWNAQCYLDNSHSPYRLRRIAAAAGFDVYNLHLLRDPRGVAMSLMTNSGFSPLNAARAWLKRQGDILRISRAVANTMRVFYEELCLTPDIALRKVHAFVGLEEQAFTGNFKDTEHHILGNRMRLADGSIRLDERWKRDMRAGDRRTIEAELTGYLSRHRDTELAPIIDYYLSEQYLAVNNP